MQKSEIKISPGPFARRRIPTRTVKIGNVEVGGENPIRLQSMTQTNTLDTEATVIQAIELFEAGAEIVRITAPGKKEAENLKTIREEINRRGYNFPLVADIHFSQSAALIAVEHVEKIRINPGNFADRKQFTQKYYTESEYESELNRLHDSFRPLVLRAKELGRAMRIGTNHGSLSDRILNRFGDTPDGMVESALEFIRIAEMYDYRDIVVSMKASHPLVMMRAYRLLVESFKKENMNYPLHLGVTEAGEGLDGRIKSIAGIAGLLEDGIGDTIRVSLTEDPVFELPVAKTIANRYGKSGDEIFIKTSHPELWKKIEERCRSVLTGELRESKDKRSWPLSEKTITTNSKTSPLENLRNKNEGPPPRAFAGALLDTERNTTPIPELLYDLKKKGCDFLLVRFHQSLINNPNIFETHNNGDDSPPRILTFDKELLTPIPDYIQSTGLLKYFSGISLCRDIEKPFQKNIWIDASKYIKENNLAAFVHFKISALKPDWFPDLFMDEIAEMIRLFPEGAVFSLQDDLNTFSRIKSSLQPGGLYRFLANSIIALTGNEKRNLYPLIFRSHHQNEEEALYSVSLFGTGLLLDEFADGIATEIESATIEESFRLSLDILQCSRLRMTRTEFISCPACGRTLFDIQKTLSRIKEHTSHLPGVKIAVMGCIVNGPGEMVDADFGYVGAGPGMVHLYRGQTMIKRAIPEENAVNELITLIKKEGYCLPDGPLYSP